VKNFTDKAGLPFPSLERLAYTHSLLRRLTGAGVSRVTSKTLGELLSVPDHTVRKDFSRLGVGLSGQGQRGCDAAALLEALGEKMGLRRTFSVCLAGLGRLGGAILHSMTEEEGGTYSLAAAFDASINRIELTRTAVPLYHSSQISRVVREKGIRLGIIAVPAAAALDVAEKLIAGGVRGIVNFTSVIIPAGVSPRSGQPLRQPPGRPLIIRNVSLSRELDVISAYFTMEELQKNEQGF
jgi:redox-sensing transcriptional repressor